MSNFLCRSLQVAALALPIAALSAQTASAFDRRDFVAHNSNSLTITQLYVYPPNASTMGPDILPGVLPSGSYTTVFFSVPSNRCVYDVMAVYRDGTYDVGRRNLCRTWGVNFYGDGGDYASRY